MELSRIKTLYCGLIFQLLFTLALPLPFTKYGRNCNDIGCLPSQVCVMAYESCSLGQREGNECGRYPTCKKNTDPSISAGPSEGVSNVYNNGPKPSAPSGGRPSNGGDDDVLGTLGLNPNNPYGQRPAAPPARPPPSGPSLYPSLPSDNNPGNRYGGSSGGGGGGSYNGGGGAGGSSSYGGGSGQFDGAGGNIIVPTRKPTPAPSGGFFGGILNGVQNAVSNAVKQQIGTYINQRLGIGPAAGGAAGGAGGAGGGLGGLFDARNLIDNKRFGGLFAENKPAGSGTGPSGTSIGPGGYPVTVDQRTSASNYQQQYAAPPGGQPMYAQNYGNYNAANTARARSTERPAYGWNLN
ncbi:keratin, type I cytoskeletal 9-like [Anopheles maculipalpis]|uniref:keratin, type I cytoskeletal 9-like n=1 Tax=Anopheles maculipalpis TaxID=1496333 RepID=UPI002159992F|nr:keratin, type I cytoskeletal 9-like [Anopheles maculipalpis]